MKPLLAATAKEMSDIRYPTLASVKLDGVRGLIIDGKLFSRSLKPIPNKFVTTRFSKPEYNGLDGELIFGRPDAKDVYRQTVGACMRIEGEPNIIFHVFDRHDHKGPFKERYASLPQLDDYVVPVPHLLVDNEKDLLKFEEKALSLGYEGVMLRSPDGMYKYGRSTMNEGILAKLKRFVDSEGDVLGIVEEDENTNEATKNELGRTKRSSAKAGKVGKDRMGALALRDTKTQVIFKVGTGFDDGERAKWWTLRTKEVVMLPIGPDDKLEPCWVPKKAGDIQKYKYFPTGMKDKPRHPVSLGRREPWDL